MSKSGEKVKHYETIDPLRKEGWVMMFPLFTIYLSSITTLDGLKKAWAAQPLKNPTRNSWKSRQIAMRVIRWSRIASVG